MYAAADHTFVVCAYKENPYLEGAVLSLKNQTVPCEVVVSTSTPCGYIEGICAKHGVGLVVNPMRDSAGVDWNFGYDQARTPLVTIAHQDDQYEPMFLESVLRAINEYKDDDVLIAFTDYFELRNGERVEGNALLNIKRVMNAPLSHRAFNGSKFVKKRILGFGNPICCPAVTLVKSSVGESVFDTRYKDSCDYKTWVNLACLEGRFLYVNKKLLGHRIYAESATSRNLEAGIRWDENEEILSLLWPKPLARLVNSVYSKSEKSNIL